jgi:hypothetical protein
MMRNAHEPVATSTTPATHMLHAMCIDGMAAYWFDSDAIVDEPQPPQVWSWTTVST